MYLLLCYKFKTGLHFYVAVAIITLTQLFYTVVLILNLIILGALILNICWGCPDNLHNSKHLGQLGLLLLASGNCFVGII